MKFFLILLLIFTSLYARPKIALVLSGGAARGGAHVGVLKVLEEKNIPIDLIVGTSMGSFVGGLYASGKSPEEIERMLVSTNWYDYIRTDFNRKDTPIRRKKFEYIYQGRIGLSVNENNKVVMPTGVLKREPLLLKFLRETSHVKDINNFDNLTIPFRAIATDIKNGQKVVLKSGSLGRAIYASSAIPGGLQPIKIDGIDLVDGGVSSNLPIEVARDMGADIIIAVDVSEHFSKDLNVNSYLVVMGQLVNILMRKNADESIKTLTKNDVLITPDLDGFVGLDADKYAPIIQRGKDIVYKEYESKLKRLSISDSEYEVYRHKHKFNYKYADNKNHKIIDEIKIVNPTYISDDSIRRRINLKVGDSFDENILQADLLHIYNMMIFDSVDYSMERKNSKNILQINTKPSLDSNGEIRFSIGLEDDFAGHSSYSIKLGYTMFGLNSLGGEWKNDFEIGRRKRAYTEIFQPLDTKQRYYLRPSFLYEDIVNFVPSTSLEYSSIKYGVGFGIGMHIGTDYEFEIGASAYRDKIQISLVEEQGLNSRPIYASFLIDSLDNLYFPSKGIKANIRWTKEMSTFGGDYEHEKVFLDIEKPFTYKKHNLVASFKYGNTYNNKNDPESLTVNDKFFLGGLFNLSGTVPYSQVGNDMFVGVIKYRYKVKGSGFFGSFNSPVYLGASLEVGDAWFDNESISFASVTKAGSIYLAADTFLGPLYLAYGRTDNGDDTFYLYLGDKF